MRNIIDAIMSLVEQQEFTIKTVQYPKNIANQLGASFEAYGKMLFAGINMGSDEIECGNLLEQEFSHLGEQNNPPDAIIRGGDAIEFKKLEKDSSCMPLNSSFPKHDLRSDSPFITEACRRAERWDKKDILYVVGVVKKSCLSRMWMVYGSEYCASAETYLRLRNPLQTVVRDKIVELGGYIMDESSKEPARVKMGIDPLDITRFRLRALWEMQTPWVVFQEEYQDVIARHQLRWQAKKFEFVAIVGNQKWMTLGNRGNLEAMVDAQTPGLGIYDIYVKNPDNVRQKVCAKMIVLTR